MKDVEFNKIAHNKMGELYAGFHPDIFSDPEQSRIKRTVDRIKDYIYRDISRSVALDFGCGTGNLTRHFVSQGFSVVAADVSTVFCDNLSLRYRGVEQVSVVRLVGDPAVDLAGEKFDVVGIYSVLHHIPDYLGTLSALMSTLRSGGILYIDREASPSFWRSSAEWTELQRRSRVRKALHRIPSIFSRRWWLARLYTSLNPRYQIDGDIHVWPDDHIDWSAIQALALKNEFEILFSDDYLSYQPFYSASDFAQFSKIVSDMRCMVFRKIAA